MKLEEERARNKSGGADGVKAGTGGVRQADAELAARVSVVRNGIYKRLKLLATWADLDDEHVSGGGNDPCIGEGRRTIGGTEHGIARGFHACPLRCTDMVPV